MIRRPPRSTLDRSSAASDVYKRQVQPVEHAARLRAPAQFDDDAHAAPVAFVADVGDPVSYTHLRAHETVLDLVCRLLLEKKKRTNYNLNNTMTREDAVNDDTKQEST